MKRKRFSSAGSRSSAAIIGGNDDLLSQILIWLPPKSLAKFKLVSKHYRYLISSKYFARLLTQNHVPGSSMNKTQHSFVLSVRGKTQFFIFDPNGNKRLVPVSLPKLIKLQLQRFECVKILQSMNGLLLLSLKFHGESRITYVVFNPTTKLHRVIDLDGYRPLEFVLVFDPSKSEYYKLIMKTSAALPYSVYDSATHEWSHSRDSSAVLYQLIVYFTTRRRQFVDAQGFENYFFDTNEHFNILQLKPFHDENTSCLRVSEVVRDNVNVCKWEICKTATVDFGSSSVEFLGMMREERIEDSAFLFHVPGRLLIYRFDHDLEEVLLQQLDYKEDELQFEYAHPFIPTFAPV